MVLIWGTTSNFPCPVCLAPSTQMSDGSKHPSRTSETMQQVYKEAIGMSSKTQQDEHLKNYGLRNVEVHKDYWAILHNHLTEFYRIFSGAFGIQIHTRPFHLTVYIQTILVYSNTYGRRQKTLLRKWAEKLRVRLITSKCKPCQILIFHLWPVRIINFPRWRGLYHFNNGALAITFSDGSTFEDLSKVFL